MEIKLRNELIEAIDALRYMGDSRFIGLYKKYEDYNDNIYFVILTQEQNGDVYGSAFEWDTHDKEFRVDEYGAYSPHFPFDKVKNDYEEVDLIEFIAYDQD